MRPELFTAGLLVALLGAALWVLILPLVFAWSVPFLVAGAVLAVISLFLPPGRGPVQPPEGHVFCAYCSNPVKVGQERCDRCNGLQPRR